MSLLDPFVWRMFKKPNYCRFHFVLMTEINPVTHLCVSNSLFVILREKSLMSLAPFEIFKVQPMIFVVESSCDY